jgi:hypothetical protein
LDATANAEPPSLPTAEVVEEEASAGLEIATELAISTSPEILAPSTRDAGTSPMEFPPLIDAETLIDSANSFTKELDIEEEQFSHGITRTSTASCPRPSCSRLSHISEDLDASTEDPLGLKTVGRKSLLIEATRKVTHSLISSGKKVTHSLAHSIAGGKSNTETKKSKKKKESKKKKKKKKKKSLHKRDLHRTREKDSREKKR